MTATAAQVEIRKPSLSPTALGDYEICGRRGQFYHDPDIPRVTNMGQALGQSWHVGMEHYGQLRIDHGVSLETDIEAIHLDLAKIIGTDLYERTQADNFVVNEGDDTLDVATEKLSAMLASWKADPSYRWMGDKPTVYEATEVEVHADLGSDHHQFHGIIDAVTGVPIYGTVPVDYKTAGRAWAHQKDGQGKGDGNPRKLIQAPLYAEAWLRMTGEQVRWFAYDVMTHAGKFERVWVDVNPEIRKPFIERWVQVSNQIEMYRSAGLDMPTNPSAMLCSKKWCSFWTYCPMGEGLEVTRGKA